MVNTHTPKLSEICYQVQNGVSKDDIAATRRRQIQARLDAKTHTAPTIAEDNLVYFWRNS